MVEMFLLVGTEFVVLAVFAAHSFGGLFHFGNEIVGIHNRSFTRFHLSVWQFDHAIAEVIDLVGPREAKLAEYEFQYFEVVVLLVADDIDEAFCPEVVVAQLGGAQVLVAAEVRTSR